MDVGPKYFHFNGVATLQRGFFRNASSWKWLQVIIAEKIMTVPIMSSDSFFHQLTVSRWICYFLLWWEVSWCSAWAFHFIQNASNCREYRLLCSRGRFFFPFSKLYRDCYRHYDDNPIMANVSSPAVISFSTTIISRWWLWSFAAVYYRGEDIALA